MQMKYMHMIYMYKFYFRIEENDPSSNEHILNWFEMII